MPRGDLPPRISFIPTRYFVRWTASKVSPRFTFLLPVIHSADQELWLSAVLLIWQGFEWPRFFFLTSCDGIVIAQQPIYLADLRHRTKLHLLAMSTTLVLLYSLKRFFEHSLKFFVPLASPPSVITRTLHAVCSGNNVK
jgi:hypothetical protein